MRLLNKILFVLVQSFLIGFAAAVLMKLSGGTISFWPFCGRTAVATAFGALIVFPIYTKIVRKVRRWRRRRTYRIRLAQPRVS